MNNQNDYPFTFNSDACKTCGGKCCRGSEGYIWASIEELENMAAAKKMDLDSFAKQYVRRVQGRLSLRENVINGEHLCCFLDPVDSRCSIYEARPQQCRAFPFWDKFKTDTQALFFECPGVSKKEYSD